MGHAMALTWLARCSVRIASHSSSSRARRASQTAAILWWRIQIDRTSQRLPAMAAAEVGSLFSWGAHTDGILTSHERGDGAQVLGVATCGASDAPFLVAVARKGLLAIETSPEVRGEHVATGVHSLTHV